MNSFNMPIGHKSLKFWLPAVLTTALSIFCFFTSEFYYNDIDGWYASKDLLFTRGNQNHFLYSPVGAPAIWYWVIDLIAPAGMELRLCHFFNYIFIAIETVVLLIISKKAGLRFLSYPLVFGYQVIVLASQIANTVYSENIYLLLICLFLLSFWQIVHSLNKLPIWYFAFVATISLMIATWIVPIIFFILSLIIIARRKGKLISAKLLVIVGLLTILAPFTNYIRFNRFTISESAGYHLWNATIAHYDDHLAKETHEFKVLKQYNIIKPDSDIPKYWVIYENLINSQHPKASIFKQDEAKASKFLGEITLKGIISNPLQYLSLVGQKTVHRFLHEYDRLWIPNKDQHLPPIYSFQSLSNTLDKIDQTLADNSFTIAIIFLSLALITLVFSFKLLPTSIAMLFHYSTATYLCSKIFMSAIEDFNSRYVIQGTPLLLFVIVGSIYLLPIRKRSQI